MNSVVYIITDGRDYKVGFTTDLSQRVKDLQVGHPSKLRVVAMRVGGNELETLIHDILEEHHLRGEWFSMSDKVLAEVMALGFAPYKESVKLAGLRRRSASKTENEGLVSFLTDLYPDNTAQNVSKDTGVGASTVSKWLSYGCMPNGAVLLGMVLVYGPELLGAVLPKVDPWLANSISEARSGKITLSNRAAVRARASHARRHLA